MTVQWIGLFRVIRHGHDGRYRAAFNFYTHGVPDELTRAAERKVAHVVGFVHPGFFVLRLGFFFFGCFSLRYNDDRFGRSFGFFKTLELISGKHLFGVLQGTSCCNDVVGRHGNGYGVVAKR